MRTFASSIVNLRCPKCEAVQGLFAMDITREAHWLSITMQPFTVCFNCGAKLKCYHRKEKFGTLVLFNLGVFAFYSLMFAALIGAILVMSSNKSLSFPVLLTAVFSWSGASTLASLLLSGLFGRFFLQVRKHET